MTATGLIIERSSHRKEALTKTIESTGLFGNLLYRNSGSKTLSPKTLTKVDAIFYGAENLSSMDLSCVSEIKSKTDDKDIPIFIFTPEESGEAKILGLESGARDCLSYEATSREVALRTQIHLMAKQRMDQLRRANESLAQQSITDGLTGVYNRRFFDLTLDSESARSKRTGKPFSLLMLDLDHFKKINDTHGHAVGDKVLKTLSEALKDITRKTDTVCRYGGEEFALIMPGAATEHAWRMAERIRITAESLRGEDWPEDLSVTLSIGVCCAESSEALSPNQIIERADTALYRAKNNGRNRTEVSPSSRLSASPKAEHFQRRSFMDETRARFSTN